ncbi:Ionotropic receptor 75h, partial [Frankliniella occidentalis]
VADSKNFKRAINEGTGLTTDYLSIFGWDLMHEMVAMLNMTINVTITNDWGRVPTGVVPDKGLLGLHAHHQIELAGTGFSHIIEPVRLKYLHFTNFYSPAGYGVGYTLHFAAWSHGVLVFRAPPLSYENNVFTLPFPLSLWETSLGMVGLCTLLLVVVMHAERINMHQGQGDHALHSSSDALLLAIAAVCQQ